MNKKQKQDDVLLQLSASDAEALRIGRVLLHQQTTREHIINRIEEFLDKVLNLSNVD